MAVMISIFPITIMPIIMVMMMVISGSASLSSSSVRINSVSFLIRSHIMIIAVSMVLFFLLGNLKNIHECHDKCWNDDAYNLKNGHFSGNNDSCKCKVNDSHFQFYLNCLWNFDNYDDDGDDAFFDYYVPFYGSLLEYIYFD